MAVLERERVGKLTMPLLQGGNMNWLSKILIDRIIRKNPEKIIRMLIQQYLPGRHLSTNPNRKTKRSHGPAIL
jgi:hypothetical protein